jgi:tetratricopeptide (TPR) repeat protein
MQQWNFDLQFQLLGGMLLDTAYAGAQGTHIAQGSQLIDQLPDSDLALGTKLISQVPNPFYGLITTGTLAAPTVSYGQLLTAYPEYTGLYDSGSPYGSSSYQSLQIKLEKRFGAGEFRRELEIAPDSPAALCGLTEVRALSAQTSRAGSAESACPPKPSTAPGHAADAVRLLSAADVPSHPNAQNTYRLIGAFLARADECFNELLARDSGSWLAHHLRAEYDELREDPQGAAAEYRAAIGSHPGDPDLRAAYAALLLQQGLAADAETQARAALDIAPESAALRMLAGRIALRQGRLPEAIESLSKAVRRQPDLLGAHALLGQAFWREGAAAAAASELAKSAPRFLRQPSFPFI